MSNLRRGGVLCFTLLAASAAGLVTGSAADGQMLARPGWVGSGLSTEMWWKHPVVYEIDVRSFRDSDGDGVGDLKGVLERLDYVQSLGVDAILLDPMVGASGGSEGAAQASAGPVRLIDPALGTLDDFDKLSEEASRRNIRILLDVVEPDSGIVRFWLNHGVAGFHPVAATASAPRTAVGTKATAEELKKLLGSFSGQRILVGDADAPDGAQLVLEPSVLLGDAGLNAAKLRAALEPVVALERGIGAKAVGSGKGAAAKSTGWPMLVSDAMGKPRSVTRYGDGTHNTEIAKLVATVLLGTRTAALIDDGQELALAGGASGQGMIPWGENPVKPEPVAESSDAPAAPAPPPTPKPTVSDVYVPYVPPKAKPKPWVPPAGSVAAQDADAQSMLSFYRQLSQLHHGTSAMHDGETIFLNHDDQNVLAWVRKPKAITPLSPAIVVLCNVSDKPVTLSLKAETTKLGIRGSFLRTVLRSDAALGSMDLQSMTLAPFQVYIGAVRY